MCAAVELNTLSFTFSQYCLLGSTYKENNAALIWGLQHNYDCMTFSYIRGKTVYLNMTVDNIRELLTKFQNPVFDFLIL